MLAVILVHFNNVWNAPIGILNKASAIGARCPQLFFIISAYLTWNALDKKPVGYIEFLKKRYLKNESITKPDKFHIHHQLLNMKFSHKKTVVIICFIDALFAFTSIIYVLIDRQLGYLMYGILMLLVLVFVLKTNVVVEHKKNIFDKIKKI